MNNNERNTLTKEERLHGKIRIDSLFAEGEWVLSYPLRAIFKYNGTDINSIMISVPKRKFKKAVKRVHIRRRIREAYRLNKRTLTTPNNRWVDVAILYIDTEVQPSKIVHKKMVDLLKKITTKIAEN